MTLTIWCLLLGAIAIFFAIIGGGVEAGGIRIPGVEATGIRIPVLNRWARGGAAVFGGVLIGIALFLTYVSLYPPVDPPRPTLQPKETTQPPPAPPVTPAANHGPLPPPAAEMFGVVLETTSTPQAAQENASKAKTIAPNNTKIGIYKRWSLWATVVFYPDNLTAAADLPRYNKDPDWQDAYVVELERWCPNPGKLMLVLPSPVGTLEILDCQFAERGIPPPHTPH
jgi:hypothetical protein